MKCYEVTGYSRVRINWHVSRRRSQDGVGKICNLVLYNLGSRYQSVTPPKYVAAESAWKTFGENTRDLGSILEETRQEYDFTPKEGLKNKSQAVETASGKLVTPSGSASDRVRKIVTASGL
ncbi:hypothetical protein Tco_1360136 [Tanacetum coccineum]